MIKFPIKFEVEASAPQGSHGNWTAQTDLLPPIPCAIPPEFMGPGGGYSPEDLFAISLLNCLMATFKVYCEKSKVTFDEIKGKVILTVDRIQPQGFAMTHADVSFHITGASDAEKARKIMDNAIKDCAVSNSIKTGKTFHIDIN
ncbi:MAG TPA: OsmC family protein [Chlamydiales bacterium]|nr:OsmC family protein [Chlamydiales bacterium]